MAVAVPSDVAARLGRPLTTDETAWVSALLDDAEALLLGRIPTLTARLAAVPPTLSVAAVKQAEAWAVVRVLRNPDGKSQEAIDDYSYTRDKSVAGGGLYISDSDWQTILGRRARSVQLVAYNDDVWPMRRYVG